jgi:hypothetical protein
MIGEEDRGIGEGKDGQGQIELERADVKYTDSTT